MKLKNITPMLAKKIGAKELNIEGTNSPDWVRVFVIRQDGCTIGRLSFKERVLSNIKWYKGKFYGPYVPLDESDEIAHRFEWYYRYGKELTHKRYLEYVEKAKEMVPIIDEEKKRKRALLPKFNEITGKRINRRALTPAGVRNCLKNIIREEQNV